MARLLLVGSALGLAHSIPAAAEEITIAINDIAFTPSAVAAHVGDHIEWRNDDFVDHTATEKEGRWDVLLRAGGFGRLDLERPGRYSYFCRFHPGMTGTIIVREN
jgi:plastocyanin